MRLLTISALSVNIPRCSCNNVEGAFSEVGLPLYGVLRSPGHLNGVGDVGAALERLHDLLGAPKAFRVRVPDPTGEGLRSTVALGGCGYLLLFGRELYAPQVMLERAHVEVALVHMRFPPAIELCLALGVAAY